MNNQPDDSEPTTERQAELTVAYARNRQGIRNRQQHVFAIRTRGELYWLMREQDWSGEVDNRHEARVRLAGVSFNRANLRGMHLYMAGLADSLFVEADLGGAVLIGADLLDTSFLRANLVGAHLAAAYLPHASLRGAKLQDANLVHAHLSHASLCGADLRGADLFGADLTGADLSGANLCSANLRATRFSAQTKLYNIIVDAKTQLAWGMRLSQEKASGDSEPLLPPSALKIQLD